MLCIVDVEIGKTEQEKARAAKEICDIIEIALPRAMREASKLPPLYKAGVKYIRQPPQACAFRPPKDVAERKGGDCKQLVLWRIAELRNAGVKATPRIIWLNGKDGLRAHAQVRLPDGTIEDPSQTLGMKAP
jgi:hypothetical protein